MYGGGEERNGEERSMMMNERSEPKKKKRSKEDKKGRRRKPFVVDVGINVLLVKVQEPRDSSRAQCDHEPSESEKRK